MTAKQRALDFDVLIVGAGISGISAAYHTQRKNPSFSYAVLEARDSIGGTWDLFRYPGIRSDSDMYTLGFPFRPWQGDKSIAQGDEILSYIKETAAEFAIDRHILFKHKVIGASWSSKDLCWTVEVKKGTNSRKKLMRCRFLIMCSGYYDYDEAHTPEFQGSDRFQGQIIHAQFWPEKLNLKQKNVVIVGSGATAITLLPSLANEAKSVTMLQRSPTYIASLPSKDHLAHLARKFLPQRSAAELARWKNILLSMGVYQYCRKFPQSAGKLLISQVEKQLNRNLGAANELLKHFIPRYGPWDQRLCMAPDGDFFKALASEHVDIMTAEIKEFSAQGIALKNGAQLKADIIILATGLKLKFLADIELTVDGKKQPLNELIPYKGAMFKDVPNFFMAFGYTNASWTLKCDLISEWAAQVMAYAQENSHRRVTPRQEAKLSKKELIEFSSGYIQRALQQLPKQGDRFPWKVYQNYFADLWSFRARPIADKELKFD